MSGDGSFVHIIIKISQIKPICQRLGQFIKITAILVMKEHRQWDLPPSSTQRISTLKRNYSKSNSSITPEQHIALLGKNRLLEDELMTEKYKVQLVERKAEQFIGTIQSLEVLVKEQKIEINQLRDQIYLERTKNNTMRDFEGSLKEIGIQISTLNEILEKKNRECQNLIKANHNLKQEQIQYEKEIRSMKNIRNNEQQIIQRILKSLQIDKEPSFNGELSSDILRIEQGILDLKQKLKKAKSGFENYRKQSSEVQIKSRQKIISLEYALKLAEERNIDLDKRKSLQTSFVIDKKMEDVIEEMLKKQEQLTNQIIQLQNQNDQLRIQQENQRNNRFHYENLKAKGFEEQIRNLKAEISELRIENSELEMKIQGFTSRSSVQVSRIRTEEYEISKKYRDCEQENKRLRLMVIELESDKQMLEKQISLRMEQSS